MPIPHCNPCPMQPVSSLPLSPPPSFAVFKVKVAVRTCIVKLCLFLLYLLNFCTAGSLGPSSFLCKIMIKHKITCLAKQISVLESMNNVLISVTCNNYVSPPPPPIKKFVKLNVCVFFFVCVCVSPWSVFFRWVHFPCSLPVALFDSKIKRRKTDTQPSPPPPSSPQKTPTPII